MLKKKWTEQGFIDEPVAEGTDLKQEIRRMCKEKENNFLPRNMLLRLLQIV